MSLVAPESPQTLDNAPGHVVIFFVNDAEVDERLLAFLESPAGGNLKLTEAERAELRPRMRLRVQITFTDSSVLTTEFITGSSNLIDPRFNALALPDLNQNDLNNVVVRCDVASVQLQPGSLIEVFIPVELTAFQLVETTTGGGALTTEFQPRERTSPQFQPIQVDQVDDDGNTVLQANVGIRDTPSPVVSPTCGSIIAIGVTGVLSVPFLPEGGGIPSFDQDDQATVAQIGGRYEFRVVVQ